MRDLTDARVAFLQNNAINESLGLCDLAGELKARGVRTRLMLASEERDLSRSLRRFDPDLVVIPCDLLGHNGALRLARLAKGTVPAPVVLGGTHPTFFPNVVLREGVDYAFCGEAEGVVPDLLAAVLDGSPTDAIPNLVNRDDGSFRVNPLRPLVRDLDDLAMPDREIYYRHRFIAKFPWKKFSTGRGCLNSCGYCFNPSYRSLTAAPHAFFRRKSAERITAEIHEVARRHPLEMVHFSDDLFSSGAGWLESFIDVYRREVALPFSCNVFASSLSAKSVGHLRRAGCRVLAMGVEVADDETRMDVMNKPVSTERIIEAARLVKEAGIRLVTFNILGLPWTSIDFDLATLELNQKIKADHTRVSLLVPFPKSALTRKLVEDGYLAPDFDERIYDVPDLPRWPAGELFQRGDSAQVERLYGLWHLGLRLRIEPSLLRKLVGARWSAALAPANTVMSMLNERRLFGLSWRAGIRYFLHVRNTALKTTNYVSFI